MAVGDDDQDRRRPPGRRPVVILQQGAWPSPLPTMPLAAGYLKASAEADPVLAAACDVRILNLPGGLDVRAAAAELLGGSTPVPEVLAASVLGWNARAMGALATAYRQVRPEGLVVFGGNHVSHQGVEVFRRWPAVDVVVDGEGERTFVELLRWHVDGGAVEDLRGVPGLTFRPEALRRRRQGDLGLVGPGVDRIVSTAERERERDLDRLPSPFLTGAIPLVDAEGRFPYDVALMETNRGCPYRCSFCYWGGAVGARVHEFGAERLRAELDLLGRHGVESVVLCDANFGMRKADLRFVHDLLEVRDRHGAPRYLEASWAKNKSAVFREIVGLMRSERLSSSFTLALQSLDGPTLGDMERRNMQINEWRDVAEDLRAQGFDAYAELIWGAPGETPASFMRGYDELATTIPRIAVYPLLVLPNTGYDRDRERHELLTVRGADDDYEYVLAHRTMTVEENLEVQRFVFWARVLAEHAYLRSCWSALPLVGGLTQSEAIRSFVDHLDATDGSLAAALRAWWRPFADSAAVVGALRALYEGGADAHELVAAWWEERVVGRAPTEQRPFLRDVVRFDLATLPVYVRPGDPEPPVEDAGGERWYALGPLHLDHDVAAVLADPLASDVAPPPAPTTVDLVAKAGFWNGVENHEFAMHHVARPRPNPSDDDRRVG